MPVTTHALPPTPIVALLTDFGSRDHYLGVVKGVILQYCPGVILVDISHDIPPYSIGAARYLLEQSLPHFPRGTIFLVVVDPGVGSEREVLLLRTADAYVLAPHNGLLDGVVESGSVEAAWSLRQGLTSASKTFHARDLFAPLVGRLAAGDDLGDLLLSRAAAPIGTPRPPPGGPADGVLRGQVLWVDRYGNLVSSIRSADVPQSWDPVRLHGRAGRGEVRGWVTCYEQGAAEAPFFIGGSAGYVEISVKQGSAAEVLGAEIGGSVEICAE